MVKRFLGILMVAATMASIFIFQPLAHAQDLLINQEQIQLQPSNQGEEVSGIKKQAVLDNSGIRVFTPASTGKTFFPKLGLDVGPIQGTKCFSCHGTPEDCVEIDCKSIRIVTTDD